jgi:hypothetical protein
VGEWESTRGVEEGHEIIVRHYFRGVCEEAGLEEFTEKAPKSGRLIWSAGGLIRQIGVVWVGGVAIHESCDCGRGSARM